MEVVDISTDEDGKVFVTFDNGKRYSLDAINRRHEHDVRWREKQIDQSERRRWWQDHVVSRDLPNSRAARADFSDGGKSVERMVAKMDAPMRRISDAERNRAVVNAAIHVAHALGYKYRSRRYAEIFAFISTVAIYRNDARPMLMKRFKLKYKAYIKRIETYTKILEEWRKKGGGIKKF